MTKDQTEKAAVDYVQGLPFGEHFHDLDIERAFKAGVDWCIKSTLHEPEEKVQIGVIYRVLQVDRNTILWRGIQQESQSGLATDAALNEIFTQLPRLVRDNRDGSIEAINSYNAAEWRGELERHPSRYQWGQIE